MNHEKKPFANLNRCQKFKERIKNSLFTRFLLNKVWLIPLKNSSVLKILSSFQIFSTKKKLTNWKKSCDWALGNWKSPQSKEVCHYRRPFDVEFLYTLEFSIDILLFQGPLKILGKNKKSFGKCGEFSQTVRWRANTSSDLNLLIS